MSTAEEIYAASTSEGEETARLAERLARQIEDDIVHGGMMGSLRELSERYGVGRAAVREAVGLLERRGLGRLRPGPYGGFIVAQPDAGAVSTELANYFRATGVTLDQLRDARMAVDLTAIGLAAVRGDARGVPRLPDPQGGLEWHLQIRARLAELSGEPALELFTSCLNELSHDFDCGGDGVRHLLLKNKNFSTNLLYRRKIGHKRCASFDTKICALPRNDAKLCDEHPKPQGFANLIKTIT